MNPADQFEAIVSEHYESLFRFALSLTHLESDARDLTQQTFYVWVKKGHQLRDFSKVKAWLFTTLHRAFLGVRRRQTRFPHHELEAVASELPVVATELAGQADHSQVLRALARVDGLYQAAVALFYLEDYSYKDIAEILDLPMGTVKSRIARGIGQLREILLPDDSSEASIHRGGSSSIAVTNEPEVPFQNTSACPCRLAPVASGASDRNYDEWDFSSTLLQEHPGAL